MMYKCDMCGNNVDYDQTEELLNKRYCRNCISKARVIRRKMIRQSKARISKTNI